MTPVLLAAMVIAYTLVFSFLTVRHHQAYGTFGFDMGLHDQPIWLMSRLESPFSTVRGMHYFGHHTNFVSALYVPAYWLGAGPEFLYVTQTVVLALGAVPVWLLARHRWGSPTLALVPAAAFLLYPSLQWINWWHWHPEAMAITPMLFAWWLAVTRRWRWFALAVVVALSTKEDVALAVVMLGVAVAVVLRARRAGMATALAGGVWFLAATRLIIPRFLDGIPFYERLLFPDFGDSLGSVLWGMATEPGKVMELATGPERLTYYLKLLGPLAFLPLLAAPLLLVAAPQLGVNVLSALPGTYDIRFQYSAMVIVACFIALVEGLGWLSRIRMRDWAVGRALLVAALAVLSVTTGLAQRHWSPSPVAKEFESAIWARRVPRHESFDQAVALVPSGAGVAANYHLIPHLTHRRHAYEWPNPFRLRYWGVADENPPDPATAEYLVLDTALGQDPDLLDSLTRPGGAYEVVFDRDGVVVARLVDERAARAAAER